FPVVTFTIMGVNVAIYLISLGFFLAQGEASEEWIFDHLWLKPASSGLHTWITSMFVHEGFFHLFGNMIYLFLFVSCVVHVFGGLVLVSKGSCFRNSELFGGRFRWRGCLCRAQRRVCGRHGDDCPA